MNYIQDLSPACYRPFLTGKYEVAPLLKPFGTPTAIRGGKNTDSLVFQIDNNFPLFRAEKIASLKENSQKYFLTHKINSEQKITLQDFIIEKLLSEYPAIFELVSREGTTTLLCKHTGDLLAFCSSKNLESFRCTDYPEIEGLVKDPLLALSLQVPEDLAAWTQDDSEDWMCWGSILLPNHWAPAEKVGKNFASVHFPVAESEAMLKRSMQIVRSMIHNGPFTRFAWGISTDTRLNHHPDPPDGWSITNWQGRDFSPETGKLWVRAERQCLFGFPEQKLSLFTIRTYFEDVNFIMEDATAAEALKMALRSMTKRSLEYKGLSKSLDSILDWIDAKNA